MLVNMAVLMLLCGVFIRQAACIWGGSKAYCVFSSVNAFVH